MNCFIGFLVVALAFTDFMLAGFLMTRIPEADFIAARKTTHTQVLNNMHFFLIDVHTVHSESYEHTHDLHEHAHDIECGHGHAHESD